jgi:hypothetical protein
LLRVDALEKWRRGEVDQEEMSQDSLSSFQETLVMLAHQLNKKAHGKAPVAQIQTEHEAAVHIHESLARFLER